MIKVNYVGSSLYAIKYCWDENIEDPLYLIWAYPLLGNDGYIFVPKDVMIKMLQNNPQVNMMHRFAFTDCESANKFIDTISEEHKDIRGALRVERVFIPKKHMNCEDHMIALRLATDEISMWYDEAYNEGPDVGMRIDNKQDINIEDTPWLIAGDVIYKKENKRLKSVDEIKNCDPDEVRVHLRAQAIMAGLIMPVDLGDYYIVSKYMNDDGRNCLKLKRG